MRHTKQRMTALRRLAIAAVALLASFVLPVGRAATGGAAGQSACYVKLANGDVQGTSLGAACAFWGIPYAASTAGPNRWRPPQPAAPWAPGVFDATRTSTAACTATEDCLWLNVWVRNAPATEPLPVIVWLHTGAFIGASANFPGSNGARLAGETGVIVVAPNYRLGPFGFLAHSALAGEDPQGSTGNYGLLDQQAALRWVRDNIAQFGGDPGSVTIAGTSAGGQSVGLQLVSPGAEGLFHRAIIQSAYPTTRWTSGQEAQAQGNAFATALGCTEPSQVLACMRAAPRSAVVAALPQASQQVLEPAGRTFWEPSVDGVVIPDQPRLLFDSGAFHRVPTVIGFNRDEGWGSFTTPFITLSFPSGVSAAQYDDWVASEFGPHAPAVLDLYPAASSSPIETMAQLVGDSQFTCEARRLAREIERTSTPVYVYSYEYVIPGFLMDRVLHGVESNILFGNSYAPPVFPLHPLTSADNDLHDQMAGYWTRFATTGSPNHGDQSVDSWPPFTRPSGAGRGTDKFIILDSTIQEGARLREAQCDFFQPLFLRSVVGGVPAAAP